MLPTLHDGDVLLVSYGASPVVGQVAVVRLPGGRPVAVKRLVADYGDGGWWVERDNPREGVDSWLLGEVPRSDVLGVALLRVWPLSRLGRLPAAPPGSAH